MNIKTILLVFSAGILCHAQEDTLKYVLPTDVVISAPRMTVPVKSAPFSSGIVGASFLRNMSRTFAADEALKLVPGVKIDNQANGSRVHLSIRGQGILTERGIRGIKILLDQIPVNDPTGFAPDFFDVDFANVERIEVLRGFAASLYGGSASGGIVNIFTQNALNRPLYGEVYGTAGSNNFWKGVGQFGGKVIDLNYKISFSRTMGDGYREHTHFWGKNIYAKANYTPDENITITPIVAWTDVFHENPEGINLAQYQRDPLKANPDAIPFNEFLETNRIINAVTGSFIFDEHEIDVNAYYKRTLFTEANNHTFNHRTYSTPGASLLYSFKSGGENSFIRNRVTAGTDLQWQKILEYRTANNYAVEGTDRLSDEEIKQGGIGFFLIDKIDLGKQWSVTGSLRYDKITNEVTDKLAVPHDLSGSADFSKATGRIGATYSPLSELNIYANWGQGFLPPATEELTQNPDQFGGFNKHLTFSTSSGYELGLRGLLLSNLYYDLAGFYFTTKNDFDRYRITDPLRNQETFYRNIGSSRRFGAELYAKYSPVRPLEIQAAYTYSNFKYTNSDPIKILMDDPAILKYIRDGSFLPNSPQHQLYVDLQYNILPGLNFGISSETLSKAYIDGANIEKEAAEGYTLLHSRLTYNFDISSYMLELSVSAKNITGKKYVAFTEPDPGGNSYQPGSGKEFFGGLRLLF